MNELLKKTLTSLWYVVSAHVEAYVLRRNMVSCDRELKSVNSSVG